MKNRTIIYKITQNTGHTASIIIHTFESQTINKKKLKKKLIIIDGLINKKPASHHGLHSINNNFGEKKKYSEK